MAKVRFGDVVRDVKTNVDRTNNPYECYVAGEHMDTEDLRIHRWGSFLEPPEPGPAFIRIFKKGQVLYGSRRTYLKKVAVADFDGITANTTFVLETKDNDVFLQDLLPFLMYTESFTQFSIQNSKGSTNPYILFSDLARFEFELPPLEEQRKLAELLWAANDTREAYKKLIAATDELIIAQYMDIFGNNPSESKWNKVSLSEVCKSANDIKCGPFGTQMHHADFQRDGIPVYAIPQVNTAFKKSPTDFLNTEKALQLDAFSLIHGDIAMSRKGNVGTCALFPITASPGIMHSDVLRIRVDVNKVNPVFLVEQLHNSCHVQQQIGEVSHGAIMAGTNVTKLKKIIIELPPFNLQNEFADIVSQANNAKRKLQDSLIELDTTYKAMLRENLC